LPPLVAAFSCFSEIAVHTHVVRLI